ncbi:MAG TPA: RNA polymerase sigma factor, partial [Acidobacteriota bacterium]|nr:RNA polymerase sigma factor [Acidobacteriota bacterium]
MSVDGKGRKPRKKQNLGISPEELEKLVERAKNGDVEAFHGIYEIFGERILNYIYRLTSSREDAEDLAQDTFILAFRKLGTLKDNRKIQSWLYRIAQNNVFQKYRGKKHYFESIDEDDAVELPETQQHGVPSKSPEEAVLSGELGELVEKVIADLPPKYREVFVLSAVQKMSYQDISEVVGRSLASVKSDIHRARVQVRDRIKEYLGENYGMS